MISGAEGNRTDEAPQAERCAPPSPGLDLLRPPGKLACKRSMAQNADMLSDVRYQFFISSTFEDLREERQQVIQAVLELGHIPVGMEIFPSVDDAPWDLIRRTILECDYYIVLTAGRYGSVGQDGLSFTEREYDLAVELEIPIIGFLREDPLDLEASKRDDEPKARKGLANFQAKVRRKHARAWRNTEELGLQASKAILYAIRATPRTGWVRANHAKSLADIEKLEGLRSEISDRDSTIRQLKKENKKLDSLLRRSVLPLEELEPSLLAQGDDILELPVTFSKDGERQSVRVRVTWDQCFRVVGPRLSNSQMRRNYQGKFDFESDLMSMIKDMLGYSSLATVNPRTTKSEIDAMMFQYKQLGLMMLVTKNDQTWWTLTPKGEAHLTTLLTKPRVAGPPAD